MADIEKVIKGLEYSWEYIRERSNPTATPKAMAMSSIKNALELLKKQPQIVRCKDCKYCNKYDYVCEHPNEWGNEDTRNQSNLDWFCADGEAKA